MKMVVIRLSEKDADLLARNVDGWLDAGACDDGLSEDEDKALSSTYEQISRQIYLNRKKGAKS